MERKRKSQANGSDDASTLLEPAKRDRFRIIPFKKEGTKKTEAKFKYPIFYLGLSRLFPLGESSDDNINAKLVSFKNDKHKKWFIDNYVNILSLQSDVKSITNYSIGETDKKHGIGINTEQYDYLTNSSGQDNLGQILLALLSLRNLREKSIEDDSSWNGGVLLIDEIESTLHPAAQNKLIQLFIQEARELNIQIVFTTHSLSLLRDICGKTKHNTHNDIINNIELYYLTNANRKLEIKRNLSLAQIESDLTISSIVQNQNKIKVYTEDDEARWFLRFLIPDYLGYLHLVESCIGCDSLISLYTADISYFGDMLIVFDGDVTNTQLSKIPLPTRDNLGNIIKLPGRKAPELILYEYLLSLESDHPFWSSNASNCGFTWDYFKENGPKSSRYQKKADRENNKSWFNDHRQLFDLIGVMNFWMKDNEGDVESFKQDFLKAYNRIAKRTSAPLITTT